LLTTKPDFARFGGVVNPPFIFSSRTGAADVSQLIMTIQCVDRAGLVAAVTGRLAESGCFIEELAQFGDRDTGLFFMRIQMAASDEQGAFERIQANFAPVAERFEMTWDLYRADERPRVLLMVSKFDHCLRDLIYRRETGTLKADFTAIVSNHEKLRPIAERAGVPFHYVPVTSETKPEAEARLEAIIAETGSELVVLARYMQVLSGSMCARHPGRVINIHHSFLPSFKGAKPYHRAYDRGVKLIGATAHYVTDDLDEGPIIEQGIERVDHSRSAEDLVAIGRDIEAMTLARAVRMHVERRVFINGHRTVVFP
jgi:formyltetrahydrofolate deformylase